MARLPRNELYMSAASKRLRIENYSNCVEMNVNKICFTQKSINNTFSNGIPIEWTINMLENNQIKPRQLPLIRIGWYENGWRSVDNRRLYCYKTAKNITMIPVKIIQITREFYCKNTSPNNGKSVRIINDPKNPKRNEMIYAFDPISS